MKKRSMLVIVVILLGLLVALPSVSDAREGGQGGGHFGGGFHGGGHFGGGGHFRGGPRVFVDGFFGFPYYAYPYGYYSYGYPYYPDAYAQPPVYSEPEQAYYWYYCQDPQGYYPYVKSCPGGWTRVVPTPPKP